MIGVGDDFSAAASSSDKYWQVSDWDGLTPSMAKAVLNSICHSKEYSRKHVLIFFRDVTNLNFDYTLYLMFGKN